MSIRFRQLQAFHAIMETGTVTGAAEHLGVSQPAISNLLAQLEGQTRVKLFKREKGRLVPTPEANLLFQDVDTVVRSLDHVFQTVEDLKNKQAGQLQVASQHSMSFGFMPRQIATFARDRPEMPISFQAQYSAKVQEWVRAGLFEIGVCELPLFHEGFDAHRFALECKITLPEGHRLASRDVLTPEDLRHERFIAMGPEHITHRRAREAFHTHNIPWRPRIHTHLFKNVLGFIKEGMGLAFLDPFALEHDFEGGFVSRAFRPRIIMDMAIITSAARPTSAIGQDFLAHLRDSIRPYTLGGFDTD